MEIKYPTVEDIIESNKKAIELLRITKAERHEIIKPKKRTSFMVAAEFLLANQGKIPLKKKSDTRFLIEIREGKRTLKELAL